MLFNTILITISVAASFLISRVSTATTIQINRDRSFYTESLDADGLVPIILTNGHTLLVQDIANRFGNMFTKVFEVQCKGKSQTTLIRSYIGCDRIYSVYVMKDGYMLTNHVDDVGNVDQLVQFFADVAGDKAVRRSQEMVHLEFGRMLPPIPTTAYPRRRFCKIHYRPAGEDPAARPMTSLQAANATALLQAGNPAAAAAAAAVCQPVSQLDPVKHPGILTCHRTPLDLDLNSPAPVTDDWNVVPTTTTGDDLQSADPGNKKMKTSVTTGNPGIPMMPSKWLAMTGMYGGNSSKSPRPSTSPRPSKSPTPPPPPPKSKYR